MAFDTITPLQALQQSYEAANAAYEAAEERESNARCADLTQEMKEKSIAKNAQKAALARACALSEAACLEPPLNLNDMLISLSHLYLVAEDFEANLAAHPDYREPAKRLSRGLEFAIGRLSREIDETLTGWMNDLVERSRNYIDASLATPERQEAA